MHELAVASDLLDLVLKTAQEHRACTVLAAHLRIGAGSCLNPEALAFGFSALSAGTPASECRLEITRTPASVRCSVCEWEGEQTELGDLSCPRCLCHPLSISGGRDLTVESISVE